MKKLTKILRIIGKVLIMTLLIAMTVLFIYTRNPYKPLDAMNDEIKLLDLSEVEVTNTFDHIRYTVDNPKKNIVIVPGGKVRPESYRYLAVKLALSGYDVTIVKTLFNLAILTPNYGAKFLKEGIDNVVIGHSLGGTVGSIFSQGNDLVTEMVFLASYPLNDVSDKRVLLITAEFDQVLNQTDLENSTALLPNDYVSFDILGGIHAQFGWYGPQKGDGTSTIDTKTQQDIVVTQILDFIE